MDWRVLVILAPLGVAAGWALFNVGAIALRQAQTFLKKES
jgi:photosystem II PsbY protein